MGFNPNNTCTPDEVARTPCFLSGSKFTAGEICQTLDVPVREAKTALKTLERLGMVRVQRSRNGGYTYIRTGSHWLRRRWR